MPSLILLLEGCDRQVYPLGKATLMIGRDGTSDLQLPSQSISANHASIIFQDGEFVLRDNGSPNGTYVNGEPVSRRPLAQHDIIRFGEYSFLVDLEDDLEIAETPETPNKEEHEEDRSKEYVPAAKSKRTYSEVRHITHPKSSSKLKAMTGSPALEIRLTRPVPHALVTAVKRPPISVPVPQPPSTLHMLVKVVSFIAVAILAVFITLLSLPIGARESVVQSEGFHSVPFSGFLKGILVRERGMDRLTVLLKQNQAPYGVKITVPRSSRLVGTLDMSQETSAPVQIRVVLRKEGGDGTLILNQLVDIPSGTSSANLFTTLVTSGVYSFELSCELEPFVGVSTGSVKIVSYN